MLREHCEKTLGVPFVINYAYTDGNKGAIDMAKLVVDTIENKPSEKPLHFTYNDDDPICTKIEKVCKSIYGAASVSFAKSALNRIKLAEQHGMAHFPVCIAKTQFSFSADARNIAHAKWFQHSNQGRGAQCRC